MKKIRLNTSLLKSLNSVLSISAAELRDVVGIAKSTWYDIMKNTDNITIQYLLAISNRLHIPVRFFFTTDNTCIIGKKDDYIIEPYVDCSYDSIKLQDIVNHRHDTTWKQAAEITGMTYQHIQKSLLAKTRLPVVRLLDVCEAFDIDPFTILIDPNPETTQTSIKPNKRNAANDIEQLRQQIAQLSSDIADLTKKYDDLRLFYEDMSHHLSFDIHHVNQSTISLVAESPATKYNKKK